MGAQISSQQGGDLDMLFKDFYKLYEQVMKARLKQNTWEHKAYIIKSKILPYFGEKSMKATPHNCKAVKNMV